MKLIQAILRKDRVQDVILALRAAGVPRLTVWHVHALGSGVDPEQYRLSYEEGSAYMEKARLELVCPAEDVDRLVDIVCAQAHTGQRGDGVIFVSNIERAVKIRSGAENTHALL